MKESNLFWKLMVSVTYVETVTEAGWDIIGNLIHLV